MFCCFHNYFRWLMLRFPAVIRATFSSCNTHLGIFPIDARKSVPSKRPNGNGSRHRRRQLPHPTTTPWFARVLSITKGDEIRQMGKFRRCGSLMPPGTPASS